MGKPLCYHNRAFFFSQQFLFTKVAPQAFGSYVTPKPNSGHKSTISTLNRIPIISKKNFIKLHISKQDQNHTPLPQQSLIGQNSTTKSHQVKFGQCTNLPIGSDLIIIYARLSWVQTLLTTMSPRAIISCSK